MGAIVLSNHQPHDYLLNRSFKRRSKKTSKLRVTGLCAGIYRGPVNSPHKWPVTRKMVPFDDVIMGSGLMDNMLCCVCRVVCTHGIRHVGNLHLVSSHPQCSVLLFKIAAIWYSSLRYLLCLWHSEAATKWPPFLDDIFKHIFLNGNVYISIKILLRFVPKGPINNIIALVRITAWRRPGDKPLSDPILVCFTDAFMRHLAVMS